MLGASHQCPYNAKSVPSNGFQGLPSTLIPRKTVSSSAKNRSETGLIVRLEVF